MTFGASLDYIENGSGLVETRIGQVLFNMEFENSDRFNFDVTQDYEFLLEPFDITDDVIIDPGGYRFRDMYVSYLMGQQRRVSGTGSVQLYGRVARDQSALPLGVSARK